MRAIVWDHEGNPRGSGQYGVTQFYPYPGWMEQDPEEIWHLQWRAAEDAISSAGIEKGRLVGIGITNQRETSVLWDARTGRPVYSAIVWQDRRTSSYTDMLKENPGELRERTGLIPDPYFSAPKVRWVLDNVPRARDLALLGDLRFGTIDSWLLWKLTGGRVHCTDHTNASRTMLFNVNRLQWDHDLLEVFGIPGSILPEVRPSSFTYGYTDESVTGVSIPVTGMIGDQQASLFGHTALSPGQVKNTYGTGSFVLVNTGNRPVVSRELVTTVAYSLEDHRAIYALEGSIFVSGAIVEWLIDGLGLFKGVGELVSQAEVVADNGGVYTVPAMAGLGAPYWDPHARGLIIGLTRGTTRAHIARSALESIAYQTEDVLRALSSSIRSRPSELRVDGGASGNDFLMQLQADISSVEVVRPGILETTSRGAAFIAGIAAGIWHLDELPRLYRVERRFQPRMDRSKREDLYRGWKEAVRRSMGWSGYGRP